VITVRTQQIKSQFTAGGKSGHPPTLPQDDPEPHFDIRPELRDARGRPNIDLERGKNDLFSHYDAQNRARER
jgi:hypothetical protein